MPQSEDKDELAKIAQLKSRIAEAKGEEPVEEPAPVHDPYRIMIELIAAIAAGGLLGWYADQWLDTQPILFIICVILGLAAGILNIYKLGAEK